MYRGSKLGEAVNLEEEGKASWNELSSEHMKDLRLNM